MAAKRRYQDALILVRNGMSKDEQLKVAWRLTKLHSFGEAQCGHYFMTNILED